MLALAYSNDTFDIYDGAVCYMFYRFFESGVGMVWARILLPDDFNVDRVSALFKDLKVSQQRSFDYWSADSKLYVFAISRHFRELNSDLSYWRNKSLKFELIPKYQMRGSIGPAVIYHEPILFDSSTDPVLQRLYRNWLLAYLFASMLRRLLVGDSEAVCSSGLAMQE
jgi:hypothetical protein